ncbi:MAG: hypothetical protein Q8941_17645 [Bacteroidota bacterium]|nr:hypothetical protein [Bacteroidota bacterium]
MKKLFIGLLVIAAGAGAFYFLQKKKTVNNSIRKELLTGKWKLDSLYAVSADSSSRFLSGILALTDSDRIRCRYDFRENGTILQLQKGQAKTDTSWYEWTPKSDLLLKEAPKDSTGERFVVNKLGDDSLVLQSKDSAVFVFTKLK